VENRLAAVELQTAVAAFEQLAVIAVGGKLVAVEES